MYLQKIRNHGNPIIQAEQQGSVIFAVSDKLHKAPHDEWEKLTTWPADAELKYLKLFFFLNCHPGVFRFIPNDIIQLWEETDLDQAGSPGASVKLERERKRDRKRERENEARAFNGIWNLWPDS